MSVGTKGPRNIKLIWLNLLKSPSFHLFFCKIILYIYFFFHAFLANSSCRSLICFVCVFDSLCAYSQWPLCLLFGGFPSLMYSMHGLYVLVVVAVGGGVWVWRVLLTACLCEPFCLPCVRQCVFAWMNYMEVHLQILNVTFVGHLCVIIRTARLKKQKQKKELCYWSDTLFTISHPQTVATAFCTPNVICSLLHHG